MSTGVQQAESALLGAVRQSAQRAADAILRLQHKEGYWWAELTADTTLESDYLLLQLWLHPPVDGRWTPPNRPEIDRAVQTILSRQLPDGGFNIYPQGPADVSATVKAYFALKLAGTPADDPRMRSAREVIRQMGGIQAANSYTKINLSLFGLYPRAGTPAIPPEFVLMPGKLLYQMSAWTRAIVVPLSIVHSANPQRPVPAGFDLQELFLPDVSTDVPADDAGFFSWRHLFLTLDRLGKWWQRIAPRNVQRYAVKKAEQWMLERSQYADGLGAIYPPMMYAIMAMDVLGYGPDHPARVEAMRQFDALMVSNEERFYFQPCFSPVWDTAIAAFALGEAGVDAPALTQAANWLLAKEVRRKGDWSIKRPNTESSGWAFEFQNDWYPDIDDTGMVLKALKYAKASDAVAHEACVRRAVNWLLAMQSRDGGWAAFDADNNWDALNHCPFADHNAMLDPTCPDITGRVLEGLILQGLPANHPAIRKAVDYLIRTQEADGSWYGRWGVAYIYGTFLAVRGLRAAGESDREAHMLRSGEFLRAIQNQDGGWGESCASYDRGTFVPAPSTPSQTAWALLGLLAGNDTTSGSVQKGIEYLLSTQREDGTWHEELATGTGFPKVFYLTYHLYRNTFPLLALAEYQRLKSQQAEQPLY